MWHTVTWDLPKWGSGLTFRREEGERTIFMKCIQGKSNKKHQGCFCLACVPQSFNSLKRFASLRIMQVLIYICGNIAQAMSIHPQSWSLLTEPDAFPINTQPLILLGQSWYKPEKQLPNQLSGQTEEWGCRTKERDPLEFPLGVVSGCH